MEKGIKKYKEGFLLGKFAPPHLGHIHLIKTASKYCEHVTVLMCSIKKEPISGTLRYKWLSEHISQSLLFNVSVVHVTDENPQVPEEHPDFWNIWKNTIRQNTPNNIDVVFSSEDYGFRLASELEIEHVLVDKGRIMVPVSGTAIRQNPLANWEYIIKPARPYFVKKIALVGAESSGKTTICKRLSEYFKTSWVPEYGREFCEKNEGKVELMDFHEIVIMQNKTEDDIIKQANKLLFCDTENITTKVFCEMYHPDASWKLSEFFDYNIIKRVKQYTYFHLSLDGTESIQDGTRVFLEPDKRELHDKLLVEALEMFDANFEIVRGNFEEKFEYIKRKIESIMLSKSDEILRPQLPS